MAKFRGKFLIHASRNIEKEKCKSLGIDYTKLRIRMVVGRAILYDVKNMIVNLNSYRTKISTSQIQVFSTLISIVSRLRMPNDSGILFCSPVSWDS